MTKQDEELKATINEIVEDHDKTVYTIITECDEILFRRRDLEEYFYPELAKNDEY